MQLYQVIAFNDFYKTISSTSMNITLAYKLNKIIDSIDKDINFYQVELKKIFEDCVEKNENGQFKMTEDNQNFIIKENKIEEFEQRFNDLTKIEVPFNEEYKIDMSLLENIDITPAQLMQIQDFIK